MLHSAILEPNLDLSLGELKAIRQINSTWPGEIFVDVELLFKLDQLDARVSSSRAFLRNEIVFEICLKGDLETSLVGSLRTYQNLISSIPR